MLIPRGFNFLVLLYLFKSKCTIEGNLRVSSANCLRDLLSVPVVWGAISQARMFCADSAFSAKWQKRPSFILARYFIEKLSSFLFIWVPASWQWGLKMWQPTHLYGLGQRGWGWSVSLGALPSPRYSVCLFIFLALTKETVVDLDLLFPIQSCHRGWRPHAVADASNCFLQLWWELLSKRLEDFPFLLLKHEEFSLRKQFPNTRPFWKPLSCRFKYFVFLQALPMSLCSKKWARVSEVLTSVKACDQKLHVCSLTAGVQGRVYIFIFSQIQSLAALHA